MPGQGIDFAAVGRVLSIVLALYGASALLSFLQGYLLNEAVQRTVFELRSDVEHKLNRLPLRYFDRQPRGEILSRVTNDIDNVSQSLQQTLSQLLGSLLTILFVVTMMFVISATLALDRARDHSDHDGRRGPRHAPFAEGVRRAVAAHGRSERQDRRSVHRPLAHESVRPPQRGSGVVRNGQRGALQASFRAQFLSGLIMPIMMFVGNLNYVVIAVLGGLRVAAGTMTLGDVQAFIQYSRQFTQPVTQAASMINLLQSGVASAERVFELLDAEEERSDEGLMRDSPGFRMGE